MQVDAVGIARFTQACASQAAVELKALGLITIANGLGQQAAGFCHTQRRQAVEDREGLLTDNAIKAGRHIGV